MNSDSIRFITATVKSDFPEHIEQYKWLKEKVRYYLYNRNDELGKGANGATYKALACDKDRNPLKDAPALVVKAFLPPDNSRGENPLDRYDRLSGQTIHEFEKIRKRIGGFPFANPLIDIGFRQQDNMRLPDTIQPLLSDGKDLHQWLHSQNLRPAIVKVPGSRAIEHNWHGLTDLSLWADVSLRIAKTVHDIHLRRLVHADIHPGNIFFRTNCDQATLIDFGESFIASWGLPYRERRPNPYLAPERRERFSHDERIDVYSIGKVMLYLATGKETVTPPETHYPGQHRDEIEKEIRENSANLLKGDPRILDIIGRCTARDPVDRPKMGDVLRDLKVLTKDSRPTVSKRKSTLKSVHDELSVKVRHVIATTPSPILQGLVARQLASVLETLEGTDREMVELVGTRDQLVRHMTSLFDQLGKGDSWTAVTTPKLWQRRALGLNGSYTTANIRAILRGAAVRRTFIVSVAELGVIFSSRLMDHLNSSEVPQLIDLGGYLELAISAYENSQNEKKNHNSTDASEISQNLRLQSELSHINRFAAVVKSLDYQMTQWELRSFIRDEDSIDMVKSEGPFFGFCPVGTADEVAEIREKAPQSWMYRDSEKNPKLRWTLIKTDASGRMKDRRYPGYGEFEPSHLLGVRVYHSVFEDPTLSYANTQALFNGRLALTSGLMRLARVANVTSVTAEFKRAVQAAVHDTRSRYN